MRILIILLCFQIPVFYASGQNQDGKETFEMVNGCKKIVSHVSPENSKGNWTVWEKQYLISKTQTCDFSAYIITRKIYVSGKISEQKQFISGCDSCDEKPCGTWIYYDKSGKEKKRVSYGDCNLKPFDTNR